MPKPHIEQGPHAFSVPFDKTNTPALGFVSDTTQEAIEEIRASSNNATSPGYPFGKSGNTTNGSWLLRVGSVPSNKTGYNIGSYNSVLYEVSVGTENIDTYDLKIYQHDGDFLNPVLITTVSVVATRKATYSVSFSLTRNKHIAVQLVNGSAKNIGVDLQITGTQLP